MEENTTLQQIWIFECDGSSHYQGCSYGAADYDDFINECECPELREDENDKRVVQD